MLRSWSKQKNKKWLASYSASWTHPSDRFLFNDRSSLTDRQAVSAGPRIRESSRLHVECTRLVCVMAWRGPTGSIYRQREILTEESVHCYKGKTFRCLMAMYNALLQNVLGLYELWPLQVEYEFAYWTCKSQSIAYWWERTLNFRNGMIWTNVYYNAILVPTNISPMLRVLLPFKKIIIRICL